MKKFGRVSAPILLLFVLAVQAALCLDIYTRVSLNLNKAPFPEAIRSIFAGSKDKFWVDPALKNLKVTAKLKKVTRDQAIGVVTRTAGVVCSVEKGTYYFRPIAKQSPALKTPAPATARAAVKLFRLRYIGAGETAAVLNASPPDGLESITATSANTLLIKGDAEALRQVAELIGALDSESALPRSVRMVLSLKLNRDEIVDSNLTAESVGPEGSAIPLSMDFDGNLLDGKLSARLTPNILPDGSVSLTGSGQIDYDSVYITGPSKISRAFDVASSVIPGTPTVIASGAVDSEGIKMGFTASITVTVEKGRIVIPRQPTTSAAIPPYPRSPRQVVAVPIAGHRTTADAILQHIWNAQPGQGKFDAMDVVVRKYNEQSDPLARNAIVYLCLQYMKDTSRGLIDRWPCEYVLQRVRYEPAIPELIDVLHNDPAEVMRAVAAEALGMWHKGTSNSVILDALKQAQRTETNQRVQDVLAKYLGKKPSS